MGILDNKIGFIKYNRWIVFIITLVLAFYGYHFYQLGYGIAWLFFLWSGLSLVANYVVKVKPVVAYGSLSVVSFVLYYTLRYFIIEMRDSPNFEVFASILTVMVGITIDALYWVYKYEKGKKFKTSYDD